MGKAFGVRWGLIAALGGCAGAASPEPVQPTGEQWPPQVGTVVTPASVTASASEAAPTPTRLVPAEAPVQKKTQDVSRGSGRPSDQPLPPAVAGFAFGSSPKAAQALCQAYKADFVQPGGPDAFTCRGMPVYAGFGSGTFLKYCGNRLCSTTVYELALDSLREPRRPREIVQILANKYGTPTEILGDGVCGRDDRDKPVAYWRTEDAGFIHVSRYCRFPSTINVTYCNATCAQAIATERAQNF